MVLMDRAKLMSQGLAPYADTDRPSAMPMPGLPLVVAGLVAMFGVWPFQPGFVGALAALIVAALIGRIVSDETRSATLGFCAAAFFLLGAALTGVSLGEPRADLLMLLPALLGGLVLRWTTRPVETVLAGVLFALASFTHAAGLWFAAAALLHLATHDRTRLLSYSVGLLLFLGGGHLALSSFLGPWYNFHTWDAPIAALQFQPGTLVEFLGRQLFGAFGVLSLAMVLSFALPTPPWRGPIGVWTWLAFGVLGASLAATQTPAGSAGALGAVAGVLTIVGAIAIQRVTQHLSAWPGSSRLGGHEAVLTALALQFLTLFSNLPSTLLDPPA